ncbi:MAG: hypothetical protein ACFE9Z_13645 [Promethearchaeota archaeon]
MKFKLLLFNIILVFLLTTSFISTVNAVSYRSGVSVDQELIWNCNKCNKEEFDHIFGSDWDDNGIFDNLSKGKRMKWKIDNTMKNETNIVIGFDIWSWTYENVWGTHDNSSELNYFLNPSDYIQPLNFSQFSSFVPFLFPIPIGEYIGGLNLVSWYDVDNRVLPTINVEISKDMISPGVPTKEVKIIAIYNDQGILNSYKLYGTENVVIIDISFDFLPFYVIPTVLGLFVGFSIGIILYIFKKRSTKSNQN